MVLIPNILAALLMLGAQTPEQTPRAVPTSAASGVASDEESQTLRDDIARRRNPTEVVCENRPVTGSRFTRRVCQTREQAAAAQTEGQNVLRDMRPGPTTDATLDGPAFGPQ